MRSDVEQCAVVGELMFRSRRPPSDRKAYAYEKAQPLEVGACTTSSAGLPACDARVSNPWGSVAKAGVVVRADVEGGEAAVGGEQKRRRGGLAHGTRSPARRRWPSLEPSELESSALERSAELPFSLPELHAGSIPTMKSPQQRARNRPFIPINPILHRILTEFDALCLPQSFSL